MTVDALMDAYIAAQDAHKALFTSGKRIPKRDIRKARLAMQEAARELEAAMSHEQYAQFMAVGFVAMPAGQYSFAGGMV